MAQPPDNMRWTTSQQTKTVTRRAELTSGWWHSGEKEGGAAVDGAPGVDLHAWLGLGVLLDTKNGRK
jgi:hypothetical protein